MLMLQDKLIDWFDAKNHDLAEGLVHLLGLEKSVLYAETELHNELTALWTNTPKSPNIHYDLSYDLTWRHHSLFNRAIQPIKDALPTYYDRAIDLYLKAKKYDLATLCLEKQANQNNNPLRQCLALADLGKNYYEGVVAPKNYVRAYAYFEKALEKGSPLFNGKQKIEFENTCLMRMAKMCFYGDSTFTRNYVQALAHLNKVQNRTSKYQSRNRNNKIDWEIGDILLLKGQIYLLGDDGVKRDLAQARSYYGNQITANSNKI